jgi:hypothetical protein
VPRIDPFRLGQTSFDFSLFMKCSECTQHCTMNRMCRKSNWERKSWKFASEEFTVQNLLDHSSYLNTRILNQFLANPWYVFTYVTFKMV